MGCRLTTSNSSLGSRISSLSIAIAVHSASLLRGRSWGTVSTVGLGVYTEHVRSKVTVTVDTGPVRSSLSVTCRVMVLWNGMETSMEWN